MPAEPTPRVRHAPIPDEAVLVVRGDELDPDVLTADAERFHRRFKAWGRYGVSAFLATDDAEVDALCETRLRPWAIAIVFTRSALEASGIEVVPTFRTPHPRSPRAGDAGPGADVVRAPCRGEPLP
jgi:hypothetical protein